MAERTTTTTELICDRCGAVGAREAPGPFESGGRWRGGVWGTYFASRRDSGTLPFDLCGSCMHLWRDWMADPQRKAA